jgi:hypothetical protein
MAIVQNPITGRTRKKFGTAVFSKIFEVNTMRTKPIEVKNPRTEAQMIQREKFATTVELMRQIIPIINEAYDGSITKMSPFNHNVSKTLKEAFDPVTHELDYSKVILCDNEGSNVEDVTMTCLANRAIDIAWDPATTDVTELAAEITILLVNADKNKIRVYNTGVIRSAGSASIIAPKKWVGDKVGIFIMATDYTSENPQPNLPHPPRILIEYKAGFDATSIVQ